MHNSSVYNSKIVFKVKLSMRHPSDKDTGHTSTQETPLCTSHSFPPSPSPKVTAVLTSRATPSYTHVWYYINGIIWSLLLMPGFFAQHCELCACCCRKQWFSHSSCCVVGIPLYKNTFIDWLILCCDGALVCFQFGAILNKFAMNIFIHVLCGYTHSFLWGVYWGVGLLGREKSAFVDTAK